MQEQFNEKTEPLSNGRLLLELHDGHLTAYKIPNRLVEITPLFDAQIRMAVFQGAIFVDDQTNRREIEDTGLLAAVERVLGV